MAVANVTGSAPSLRSRVVYGWQCKPLSVPANSNYGQSGIQPHYTGNINSTLSVSTTGWQPPKYVSLAPESRASVSRKGWDAARRFAVVEAELAKRTADIAARHKDELHALRTTEQAKTHEIDHANRRVEDSLREVADLRERNHELEAGMSKVSRIGKREEMDFADEARSWAGVSVSEKLGRNGDFILAYRDASGAPQEPRMLIDCKDKATIGEADIAKLVRDSKERSMTVAILVARDETQLRQVDKENRWDCKDRVWLLRTCRQWLPRDLDVLKPLFERMRVQGSDFLDRNAALADEVRRTFADLDRFESELKKASKAITSASGLVAKYRGRLQELCDNAAVPKMPSTSERSGGRGSADEEIA